ncbi:MAG: sensor histidine kinase, partial [Gemmatimonadaceae bacterium]
SAGYVLTVSDSGGGVPLSSRPFIFDRFYRADATRRSDESKHGSGAGLGLSIAREIAELHGGRLELVDSTTMQNSGTMFEVFLPVSPDPRP